MGQYHYVVNLDKQEYLHPHKLGDGLKLAEFGASSQGTMMCLAVLLADSCGRGSGDFRVSGDLVGSWAGDRIVITGDYGDAGKFYGVVDGGAPDENLFDVVGSRFKDISNDIRAIVEGDIPLGPARCWR
jgi:hypothetical protein